MTRRTLVAPLALALAAGALVAPATSGAAAGCTAGLTKVAGKQARTFCGPAKATATVGGKTLRFSGGDCVSNDVSFSLNIGTTVISTQINAKPGKVPYFGMVIVPSDAGVHLGQAITWVSGGKRYSVFNSSATLASSEKKGSFKGTLYPGGARVTGTFTC